jgi:hypothetical protein
MKHLIVQVFGSCICEYSAFVTEPIRKASVKKSLFAIENLPCSVKQLPKLFRARSTIFKKEGAMWIEKWAW